MDLPLFRHVLQDFYYVSWCKPVSDLILPLKRPSIKNHFPLKVNEIWRETICSFEN
jgi:hypothetical protein